jgi:hypothetical protein
MYRVSRNREIRCPIGILVSILSPLVVVFCWLLKIHRPRFERVSVSETENVEVLNGALFMTQNAADRVSRLRSRTVVSPGCSHP